MDPATSWVLDSIKALGVAGGPVFAILWWLERTERRAAQKDNVVLVERALTIANGASNSLAAITAAIHEMSEATKDSVANLTRLVRALGGRK